MVGARGGGSKKGKADKTADPLGMFPLANWISMTDLHFHMGREQEGGENRQEVVTGKLIFERGRSPINRRRKGRSKNFRSCRLSRLVKPEFRIGFGIDRSSRTGHTHTCLPPPMLQFCTVDFDSFRSAANRPEHAS